MPNVAKPNQNVQTFSISIFVYLAVFVVVHALEQAVQEVACALLSRARLNNAREHVAPHDGAADGQLGHHAPHEGHDAGREVDEAAVVHLPEDLVELLDVLVVLGVAVLRAGRVAEVVVENIGASLKNEARCCGERTEIC